MSSEFSPHLSGRMSRSVTEFSVPDGASNSGSVTKASATGLSTRAASLGGAMVSVTRTLPKELHDMPLTTSLEQASEKLTASLAQARDAGVSEPLRDAWMPTRAEQDSADYNVDQPQHAWQRDEVSQQLRLFAALDRRKDAAAYTLDQPQQGWQREEMSQQARLFAELASHQAASAPSIPSTASMASLKQAPEQSQVQRWVAPAMPAPSTAVQQLIARCTSGHPGARVGPLTELLDGLTGLTGLATERSTRLATAGAVVHALAGLPPHEFDHALAEWPVELLYLAHGEAKTQPSNAVLAAQISACLGQRAGGVMQERAATLLDRGRQVSQGELMHSLSQLGDSLTLLNQAAYTSFDELAQAASLKLAQDPGLPVVAAMNVNGRHWVSVIAQRQGDGIRFDLLDSNHAGPARPEWAKLAASSGHGEIGFVGMKLQDHHPNACGPLQAAFSRHLAHKADANGRIEVADRLAEWKADWDKLSAPEQQLSVAATRAQMLGGLAQQTTNLLLDALA